jgi:hypothetical protein
LPEEQDIPNAIQQALSIALLAAHDATCPRMRRIIPLIEEISAENAKTQIRWILPLLATWHGPAASEAKRILKEYIST